LYAMAHHASDASGAPPGTIVFEQKGNEGER
jgi:hypothetical protein